jgi:hypothetical protein
MYFLDELNCNWRFIDDFFLQEIITELLILLFHDGTRISGKVENFAVLKDLSCVMIGDFIVFDFTGMVGKKDSEIVQIPIQCLH